MKVLYKEVKEHSNDFNILKEILNADRVSKDIGLLKCIQCGLCTASCPAARYTDFSPRKIMNAILQGDSQIIQDERIWNCFSCYTCHLRCPRNNSPITIIQALKQISIEKGYNIDKLQDFLAYGESFTEFGAGALSKEMVNKLCEDWGEEWLELRLKNEEIREGLGLKTSLLPIAARKEIYKILEQSGFIDRLKKLREHLK